MISKALVAASTKPMILSILARYGESYGYAIIQRVKALSGGELEWQDGMLYPVLHRLERDGLVGVRWGASPKGRKRKYYTLSPAGQAALDTERRQWEHVNGILTKLWNPAPRLT
jgi:DNA-binding PadR family transcriptional regulator